MAGVLRINETGQIYTSGSRFFCERVSLVHGSNAILLLYNGNATDNNKELISALGCLANSSDSKKLNYDFKNGIYAELTATGSGFGVGLLYQR